MLMGVAACATPTPYRPAAGTADGYRDQQLEADRYRVSFAGNSLTPPDTVANYILYRAAELTLQTGNDYFVMVSQALLPQTTYFGDGYAGLPYAGGVVYGRGYFGGAYFGGGYIGGPGIADAVTRYSAYADIVVRKGKKPDDNAAAYDARDLHQRLEPFIVRQPPQG
jgi:hypothetical protein